MWNILKVFNASNDPLVAWNNDRIELMENCIRPIEFGWMQIIIAFIYINSVLIWQFSLDLLHLIFFALSFLHVLSRKFLAAAIAIDFIFLLSYFELLIRIYAVCQTYIKRSKDNIIIALNYFFHTRAHKTQNSTVTYFFAIYFEQDFWFRTNVARDIVMNSKYKSKAHFNSSILNVWLMVLLFFLWAQTQSLSIWHSQENTSENYKFSFSNSKASQVTCSILLVNSKNVCIVQFVGCVR